MLVENWSPRALMSAANMIGTHVRVDPLSLPDDIPLLWDALGGNDRTMCERLKWWGLPDLIDEDDMSRLLESVQQPPGCCVNVLRLVTSSKENDDDDLESNYNQVAGMSCYIGTRAQHGTTEVGYVVHGQAMTRSPAATEAHYLLAKHAFEVMKYRRYEWKCDSNNLPSKNAALRLGFTFEGCFRQHVVTAKGRNRDTNWYSMIDSEWPLRKKALEAWLDASNFDAQGNQRRRLQEFQNW